jgi:5-methylcytosine-specific restriction protein A
MAEGSRKFRSDASLEAERITRDAIVPFLRQRGFDEVTDHRTVRGTAITQVVTARDGAAGELVKMHVRLCWRRDGRNATERDYSAAQLRARLINGNWDETLDFIASRDREEGNTHTLIAQYDDRDFAYAALIPCEQIKPIWKAQREISDDLIRAGKTGRTKKNHATNGSSPTIWLHDSRTPEAHPVADVLWSWPGVVSLLSRPVVGGPNAGVDDTYDDCPTDYGELGRDAATKFERVSSGYPRDAKVRAAVVKRANGSCERSGCGARRDFAGFLDVHHILGVGTSDRPSNCVALCPNCHREAHFAPDRDTINAALHDYARAFSVRA